MLQLDGANHQLDILKDPFMKSKIKGIRISLESPFLGENWHWNAYVDFKNGNTEGKQRFKTTGIDSFGDLVAQVRAFINSLKDEP